MIAIAACTFYFSSGSKIEEVAYQYATEQLYHYISCIDLAATRGRKPFVEAHSYKVLLIFRESITM